MEQGSAFSRVGTAGLMLVVAVATLIGADTLAHQWLDNPVQAGGVAVALRLAAIFVAGDALWMVCKVVYSKVQPLRRRRDGAHRADYGRIAKVVVR